MELDDVCLSCGHNRQDHNPGDDARCHSPHCPCLKFKSTKLENY